MSKYCGAIGYETGCEESVENPGVFRTGIVERTYYGDISYEASKWMTGSGANDDLSINQKISIVADPYAYQNYTQIRYATILGQRWKVASVEVQRPRITLTLGGVWNGEIPSSDETY